MGGLFSSSDDDNKVNDNEVDYNEVYNTKVNDNEVDYNEVYNTKVNDNEVDYNEVHSTEVDYDKVEFWDEEHCTVRRVVCCLEKLTNVDVIVNSTDRSLNLNDGGKISKTILKHAGRCIQKKINQKYPNGIQPGEIAVTEGYNLPYTSVLHCSLQNISKRLSHHEMREVVTACLQAAEKINDRPYSIAFPAIGTGCMGFNRRLLKTIYRTLLEFIHNKSGNLKTAYIIIYPGNAEVKDYAKYINPQEESERISYPAVFPPSWTNNDDICRIELDPSDFEYSDVLTKFQETICANVDIIKIERIENKRLYVTSRWYRKKLIQAPTKELWHGTNHGCIAGIIRYGFDWRLVETFVFGKGCYFTDKAFYSNSDQFSPPNAQGEKCMFLVDVTIGKTIKGRETLTELDISNEFQTSIGVYDDVNIFVTYDDDQIYPLFLIVYKKK